MHSKNLFALPPLPLTEELTTLLAQGGGVRVERVVSAGQTTGWYDQEETEFVALLAGEAELTWQDGSRTVLAAGDTLTIPPHQPHRVSRTSTQPPCVWLCVFWQG